MGVDQAPKVSSAPRLSWFKRLFAGLRCFEAGAAMLFFGVLSQQADIQQAGSAALQELAAQGYKIPDENEPVRVFPALTDSRFSARHAGGWRPGSIFLRNQPEGGFAASTYLRHELFHEASFRTCGGRLPLWAEEAAAMRFSGELAGSEAGGWPSDDELQGFISHLRQHPADLDNNDRILLKRMAAISAWPAQPCAVAERLKDVLDITQLKGGSAYVLINLQSGRILESGGDQRSRLPPGSLLKIPYAAALQTANPAVLGRELARSDTDKLLERREQFNPDRYRLLLTPLPEKPASFGKPLNSQDSRALLGERDTDGKFPLQANLPELALALRAAWLSHPDYFQGLAQNGVLADSTLAGQAAADTQLLQEMQVMAKTGSVSTATGLALAGHLVLAWPVEHPVFLAVFRQQGLRGADLLPPAATLLKKWRPAYPPEAAGVRVRLLTAVPRHGWEAVAECPEVTAPPIRYTTCGHYRIVSNASGSRSERLIDGVLHETDGGGPAILETDIAGYADAVLAAEAQTLTGSAREAMRAVIAWNGMHGNHRHPDTGSLCDTTHCMVFLGKPAEGKPDRHDSHIDMELVQLLDQLAAGQNLSWLPFSSGGNQQWRRQIPASRLATLFAENRILDIRRERRKNGELTIHLYYPENEESMACEIFRNTLKLPSCPDAIMLSDNRETWEFQGIGAGHGLGLSILQAQALADHGRTAKQILLDAFGKPDGGQ